jgi:hypothetical protein
MSFDLAGEGKATDAEIQCAADNIFNELRIFDSPKDAGPAFALAHYMMIKAVFPPEHKTEAFNAIDAHVKILKEFLSEDWQ